MILGDYERSILCANFSSDNVRSTLMRENIKKELVDLFCFYYACKVHPRIGIESADRCSISLKNKLSSLLIAVRETFQEGAMPLFISDQKFFEKVSSNAVPRFQHLTSPLHVIGNLVDAGLDYTLALKVASWYDKKVYKPFDRFVFKSDNFEIGHFLPVHGVPLDSQFAFA